MAKVIYVEADRASKVEVVKACECTSPSPSFSRASFLIEGDKFSVTFTCTFTEKWGHCGITFIFLHPIHK
jgi:hypothetical protein